jgi:hypothetical protein
MLMQREVDRGSNIFHFPGNMKYISLNTNTRVFEKGFYIACENRDLRIILQKHPAFLQGITFDIQDV